MVTLNDVWKHISNKIANKVNDPFEELFASVIPIDRDDNFLDVISSDCAEYEGDSYVLLRKLVDKTHLLPSGGFVYFCPAKVTQVDIDQETGKQVDTREKRKCLVISLVHPIVATDGTGYPSSVVIDNGIYWLDTNEFQEMPPTINGEQDGQEVGNLPMALGALALKCALDNGSLGDLGVRLLKALAKAEESLAEAEAVFESLKDN